MTYDDDYGFRPIFAADFLCSVPFSRRSALPLSEHASTAIEGVLSLAASDISCSLPAGWELETSLGRPAQN